MQVTKSQESSLVSLGVQRATGTSRESSIVVMDTETRRWGKASIKGRRNVKKSSERRGKKNPARGEGHGASPSTSTHPQRGAGPSLWRADGAGAGRCQARCVGRGATPAPGAPVRPCRATAHRQAGRAGGAARPLWDWRLAGADDAA